MQGHLDFGLFLPRIHIEEPGGKRQQRASPQPFSRFLSLRLVERPHLTSRIQELRRTSISALINMLAILFSFLGDPLFAGAVPGSCLQAHSIDLAPSYGENGVYSTDRHGSHKHLHAFSPNSPFEERFDYGPACKSKSL